MKNRKGFTLIELMSVVLVLSILLVIAVPSIMRYMKNGTLSYYRSLEKELKVAGVDYMETYRPLLPKNINHVSVVDLQELVDNKYIDPVKDEKGYLCTGQVAIKKIKTDRYEYHSCLKCGEYYESEEQECNYSEEDNVYEDSGDYRIEVDKDYYKVNQLDEFISPLARVYYKDQLVKTDLEGHPKKLDTSRIGIYTVKYYYHGAKKSIQVEVVDITSPNETKVVLKYDNKNGKNYKGNWYSGNIYVEYKSTDYTTQGIAGVGIDHYETSEDGVSFKRITGNSETLTKEGNYLRYVRAVDKAGNTSKANKYRIKIDKTSPYCDNNRSWQGESTVWTASNRTITATCFDDVSECSDDTKTRSWIFNTTTKTQYLYFVIKDLAGNTNVCDKTVNAYVDKTPPTCSDSGTSCSWTRYSRTVYWGCSDGTDQSGCTTNSGGGSATLTDSCVRTYTTSSYTISDNVGHQVTCPGKDLCVKVDKGSPSNPSITVTDYDQIIPVSGYPYGGDVTVKITEGSDSCSGTSYTSYSLTGAHSTSSSFSSSTYSRTLSNKGTTTIYATSYDQAGNATGSASLSITIKLRAKDLSYSSSYTTKRNAQDALDELYKSIKQGMDKQP